MEHKPREIIFISHANPSDNDFTKWLSLKLISLGYDVWCDILSLDKGRAIWQAIENEIRINTCKFLIILSEKSNTSEGVLNEIGVAIQIKKELKDENFVIPLLIDNNLSFDKINIQLNRLNVIDFRNSWITGFRELITSFTKNNVPKKPDNYDNCNSIYKNIFLNDRNVIIKDEIYNSNWFSILSLPKYLYFHSVGTNNLSNMKEQFPYPVLEYKNYLCTFSEDIGSIFPNSELIENNKKIVIPTLSIINRSYDTEFARNFECKKFIVQLLNKGFKYFMTNKKLRKYSLSSFKTGYWFEINQIEKNKINKVLFVGKRKEFNWHFGISGLIKLIPFPILILSSHIFFTTDGKVLVSSKSKQHKLRRKQGATWYNDNWNDKLLFFAKYLSNVDDQISIPVGIQENIIISSTPIEFISRLSYINPKDNIHEEDTYISVDDFLDDNAENEDVNGELL